MATVEAADGTPIAYEQVGVGRPLVCVHGTGATAGTFRGFASSLEDVSCVLVERRGRGDSGDADAYALDREVEDLLAVLDEFEPPAVLGHSYGGIVAFEAARRTDRLSRLAVYEPPVLAGTGDEGLASSLADRLDAGQNRAVVRQFFDRAVGEAVDDIWPTWEVDAPPARTFVREVTAVEAYDLPTDPSIDIPTLLLSGEESPRHLRDSTRAVADVLPSARLVTLEGIGHAGLSRAPDRLASVIGAFLQP